MFKYILHGISWIMLAIGFSSIITITIVESLGRVPDPNQASHFLLHIIAILVMAGVTRYFSKD